MSVRVGHPSNGQPRGLVTSLTKPSRPSESPRSFSGQEPPSGPWLNRRWPPVSRRLVWPPRHRCQSWQLSAASPGSLSLAIPDHYTSPPPWAVVVSVYMDQLVQRTVAPMVPARSPFRNGINPEPAASAAVPQTQRCATSRPKMFCKASPPHSSNPPFKFRIPSYPAKQPDRLVDLRWTGKPATSFHRWQTQPPPRRPTRNFSCSEPAGFPRIRGSSRQSKAVQEELR
jgi:hypothetical protein